MTRENKYSENGPVRSARLPVRSGIATALLAVNESYIKKRIATGLGGRDKDFFLPHIPRSHMPPPLALPSLSFWFYAVLPRNSYAQLTLRLPRDTLRQGYALDLFSDS
jgi:hypothetical protein